MSGYHGITPIYPESSQLFEDEKECRNCHTPGGDDLIAPCACSGSIRYVHRSCLNSWRAVSPNPLSFDTCDVCGSKYVFKERGELKAGRIRRFVFYVARDFIGAMLIVQIIIALLSVLAWQCDTRGQLRNVFPKWHLTAVYYIWGLFLFSVISAVYGFVLGIYWCCSSPDKYNRQGVTHDSYPYFWGYYYIWFWNPMPGGYVGCCPACDCSGPGCCAGLSCHCPSGGGDHCGGGSSDNGMGIAAIVVLAIGVIVGFIVMVVIATLIIKMHVKVLQKYQDAREMEVVDLEKELAIHTTEMV